MHGNNYQGKVSSKITTLVWVWPGVPLVQSVSRILWPSMDGITWYLSLTIVNIFYQLWFSYGLFKTCLSQILIAVSSWCKNYLKKFDWLITLLSLSNKYFYSPTFACMCPEKVSTTEVLMGAFKIIRFLLENTSLLAHQPRKFPSRRNQSIGLCGVQIAINSLVSIWWEYWAFNS